MLDRLAAHSHRDEPMTELDFGVRVLPTRSVVNKPKMSLSVPGTRIGTVITARMGGRRSACGPWDDLKVEGNALIFVSPFSLLLPAYLPLNPGQGSFIADSGTSRPVIRPVLVVPAS
jgi:hypothetical protein